MWRFTDDRTRKIVYLVLLILQIGTLIGASMAINPTNKLFLWQMIIMSSTVGVDMSVGAYIIAFLVCIIVCTLLINISSILRKRDSNYFSALGTICVLSVICLIANTITKTLGTFSVVLLSISLAINIISSLFCFICTKYNYQDEDSVEDNKVEESKDGKVEE